MSQQLKVVHTPVRYAPFVGGVEKYVQELSEAMVRQEFADVTVVCANEPESPEREDMRGVHVQRLPYVRKVANTNITPALFSTLRQQDCDLIHTHIPTPWSADVSALVSLIRRKPLVVTYHNDLVKGGGLEALIAKTYNVTFLRLLFMRASKIIVTQPKYVDYSSHLQPFKSKIAVVPVGVGEPRDTTVDRDPNQLFFLSVLDEHHEYKGLDVLLEAVAQLKQTHPKTRLKVGGKGKLVEKYRKQAEMLGIGDAVDFLGYITDEQLADLYASSGAFVLPSVNNLEGFGIVALEALSYGTPVVTTEITGSSSFIKEKEAGIIVQPRDVGALALALQVLVDDPATARAMGQRGAKAVMREFGWDGIAQRMAQLYREIV